MKVVELFGAPGVGKTTLYERLCAQRSRSANWIPEAKVLTRLRPAAGNRRHVAKWLFNRLASRPQGYLMDSARDAFVAEYTAFAGLCWSLVHQHRGHESYPVDTRFGAATHYWNCFGRVANLRAANDRRFALMDEGLLQRLTSLWSPAMNAEQANAYVAAMPVPSAAILFFADENEVLARIKARRRWSGNHLGMSDEQLCEFSRQTMTFSRVVGDVVSARGVPVCRVNADDDPGANVASIAGFINALR